MAQYKRLVTLTIVCKDETTAKVVNGLRVCFDIKKSSDNTQNHAVVEVYNLAPDTRDLLNSDNVKVILQAGYDNEVGVSDIFRGDVYRSHTVKQPPDIVTTIESLDGLEASLRKISVGYSPSTSGETILRDLAKITGAEINGSSTVKDKSFKNGFSTVGSVKNIIGKISEFLDVNCSFQNEAIKYYPRGNSDKGAIRVLSAETGLLETPVRIENTGSVVKKKAGFGETTGAGRGRPRGSKRISGWKVKSLLLPEIEPGNKVVIHSDMLNGEAFVVATVNHKGDNFGQNWFTELEVEELKNVKVLEPNKAGSL